MPIGYYESGTLPEAASKLAVAFHEVWWRSEDFTDSVAEWQDRVAGDIASPLKFEISKLLASQLESFVPPGELAAEWDLLTKATVDGLITTNYDQLLSIAFPDYELYVGQDGLLFSDPQGIAEIYAIHGTASDPASLVLTAEDYVAYDARNAYLAAKLMTVFVEHPVVFLGYSFNDPNIHSMLLSLVNGLREKSVEKLQDRLIFVEWSEGAEPSIQRTHIGVGGQLLPVIRIVVPDWVEVFEALGQRQHALNARTLRILKQQVYEIVLENDPKERLFAYRDIDDDTAKDISIVFGVGAKVATVGIVGLSRPNVWTDILENPNGGYPAAEMVNKLISGISSTTYYPVFKYLRELNLLNTDGTLIDKSGVGYSVEARVASARNKVVLSLPGVDKVSVATLEASRGWDWMLNNALHLPAYTDDVDGLRIFLIKHSDKPRLNLWWPTQYAKAIVAYDYVKFGLG